MYEINRSVIIVVPQEPFWHWLNDLPDSDLSELSLEDLQEDANSYLIPACDNADQVWEEVAARVEQIFAAELADWCEDENQWPDLHIDIFSEWFEVQLSSVLIDLDENKLEREPFETISIH